MDALTQLVNGFTTALESGNLSYCFAGVLLGTIIGVLPGLGPSATIALLLPITYGLPADAAIILLAGIYYGAMYGGSTTSILLDLPGEAASVVTCIDGYQMAKKGRAGPALCIAAIGSFIGGTVALIGLTLLAPWLASFALCFGPPEYFSLGLLGLSTVIFLSKYFVKSLCSAAAGLLIACIGQDPILGGMRFTFGRIELSSGIEVALVAMGFFGVAEILYTMEQTGVITLKNTTITQIWPSLRDWAQAKWAVLRGSLVGFFVGVLPGGGAILSSVLAYGLEKKLSDNPSQFGNGEIKGVAAPESANNAAVSSAFIPLLTLGLPSNAVMALLYAAFLIHGIQPGPLVFTEQPQLFWSIVSSMYIGNVILLILNLPLISIFICLLKIRYCFLAPMVLLISLAGAYSLNNNLFDMWILIVFGGLGYLMRKFAYDIHSLVLAFILGSMIERSFRQSLLLSNGSLDIFISRPISVTFLVLMLLLGYLQFLYSHWKTAKGQS